MIRYEHPLNERIRTLMRLEDVHARARVYVAGDTEDVPEMAALRGVDVAFLPCDGTSTMTPGMLTKAVAMVRPKILHPYHSNSADLAKVEEALKGVPGMELRIRPMK